MNTATISEKNPNSHNNNPLLPNPAESNAPPSIRQSNNPPIHSTFLPAAIRNRRFRAFSFASKLDDTQRAMLTAWLCNKQYSIEQIRQKVANPPPDGFGMEVQPTTLRRLRNLAENVPAITHVSDAMDTACDLLENEDTSETAPLRRALITMLYSRAVSAAQKQAGPEIIDKLVATIARLEKLGSRPAQPRASSTRHHIELSIIPSPTPLNLSPPAEPKHPNRSLPP